MIVEERIYDLNNGAAAEFVNLLENEGAAIQRPILGRLVGYYRTEIGPQNQIVHLWAYKDLAERAQRRAQMLSDPRWIAFSSKLRPLVNRSQNKILVPLSFSPLP